jgi:glycosyltransferase involved in cell wall biosynthesis
MTVPSTLAPALPATRIAYLVSRYPAVSHTFILREVLGLQRLGLAVDVASVNPPDRPTERMTDDERGEAVRTYVLKRDGVAGALRALGWAMATRPLALVRMFGQAWGLGRGLARLYGLAYGIEAVMVARWMAVRDQRHLHVHFGTVGSTVGLLVKHLTGCGLSLTIHGPDEFDEVGIHHLVRKVAEADRIVCISQFARSQLMRLSAPEHWHKLVVCRLGVQAAAVAPAEGLADAPARALASAAPVRLLSIGRLTPAKGQTLMLDALARLQREGLDCVLTIVGDGPDRPRLEAQARQLGLSAERVCFTGSLNQAEVRTRLAEADAFVLPSLAEGIPVVLMEAMVIGVPCVTTPANGIPELVRPGENGLLATMGDVESLTDRLREIVTDAALRTRLGAAARARVAADFDLDRNVAALASILRELPGTRPVAAPETPNRMPAPWPAR